MNYYELKYLKHFIKSKLVGLEIVNANTRYRNLIEFFIVGEEKSFKLVCSTAPGNTALFIDNYSNAKKKNTISFFEEIYGLSIENVEVEESDRIIYFHFEDEYKLIFKLFGNQANVLLTRKDDLLSSFKGSDIQDQEIPKAKKIAFFKSVNEESSAKEKLIEWNVLLPRDHLDDLLEAHELNQKTTDQLHLFCEKITHKIENEARFRLLVNQTTTLFDEQILPLATEREFESINDLIAYRFKTYSHNQRLKQQKGEFLKQLKRQLKRTKSGLRNLEQADKGLERKEKYEKYGHLLMANGHVNPENSSKIDVEDFYEDGKTLTIPLNDSLSIVENAEKYYQKARNSLKSYEEALERLPVLKKKMDQIEELLNDAQSIYSLRDLSEWNKKNSKELKKFGIGDTQNSKEQNLPFYIIDVDGYPVWIGKNARSNDELVKLSHKEDVWLHARGVAGSHAIIRMSNKKEMPPKSVLSEVASYAAFNSKAKGAEIVPVIITKRKYIRKPKGAAPGAVVVEKEEVEFVTPKNPAK